MSKKSFYITTPIYYVNAAPHIGHAYTTIAADVAARYHRQKNDPTYFLTGTDEHGIKILQAATDVGKSPKEFVDGIVPAFIEMSEKLNCTNDHFVRTTDDYHEKTVQNVYAKLKANGDIYAGEYEGYYHTADERFITETEWDEIKNSAEAKYIKRVKERNYFFKLSKYEQKLLDYIEQNPDFIQPDYRRNEVIGYIKKGLKDLSVTRTSFNWGIPVPDDPEHVIYVWIDALTNYISALGYSLEDDSLFKKFWPANYHLIGKDILVFHAIYWPAMLMSLSLPLPKTIYAHGWWTANGAKISKRAGNVINPYDIIDKYGLDPFRFFLFKENVFGRDGDFSEPALIMRFNSELVNDLSNLLNRTISMTKKYIGNVVPSKLENPPETEIQDKTASVLAEYHKRMERLEFREALCAIFELTDAGNKYVDTKAPWTLMKEGRMDELNHVLYSLLESLRVVSIMLNSFMPETARRIQAQLGVVNFDVSFSATEKWGGLISGSALGETKHLFSRIPQEVYDEAVKRQKEILDRIAALEKEELEKMQNQNKSENAPAETVAEAKPAEDAAHAPEGRPETKEEIDYDLFSKVDLRLAKVIAAEKVPKADKLLKLTVDAGDGEPRTIVAGIAAVYTPEQMVGRRIVVVANLKPRKLKGIESKGMLLAASDHSTGKLAVVTLKDGEDMPAGTKVS